MFRHIKVVQAAINKLSALWRDTGSLQTMPPIGVAPLEPRTQKVDLPDLFSQRPKADNPNSSAARRAAADAVGKPFPAPWIKRLPKGYFWKQDPGALDGVRHGLWRIYRGRL